MDDLIHIPPAAQLDLTGNFTVSAWVNVYPGCGESSIFYRGDAQRAHDPYALFVLNRQMGFKMDGWRGNEDERAIGDECPRSSPAKQTP